MDYILDENYTVGYGYQTNRKIVIRELFIKRVTQQATRGTKEHYGSVSTTIKRIRFRSHKNICIMALDCDSLDATIAAARCLKRDNINWVKIESSPNNFWIITDFIAPFNIVRDKMHTIVGVDDDYIRLCEDVKTCLIRAAPIRKGTNPPPDPPDIESCEIIGLTNQKVLNWLREYKKLISDLSIAYENAALKYALDTNQIDKLAADPTFDI